MKLASAHSIIELNKNFKRFHHEIYQEKSLFLQPKIFNE